MEATDVITDRKIISGGADTTDGLLLMVQCSGGETFGAVITPIEAAGRDAHLSPLAY
jgi:hypothetical protein